MPAPELLQYVEDWLSSTSLLPVQLQLLSVDSSCSVAVSSSTEGECNAANAGGSGESSSASAVIGIVAGVLTAVVVLVIIVALIVILALVYRHRYSTINIKERE